MILLQLMVRADTSGSGVARQIYLICVPRLMSA